jgi:molecular chaperone HscC
MSAKTVIGIDLGTTYSLVSVLRDGVAVVLPNGLGEHLTPSAVSIDEDGRVLVGAPARARAITHPEQTAVAFKRDMGTARKIRLGGRELSPIELSSLLLRTLKEDAEAALGRPVDEAVVTVPAYFGNAQREATREAASLAGLHVERIINEPTAAALAYGLHEREKSARVVVLDLGGGTFDVTVLQLTEGIVEILSSAGDARLGGEDFTDRIAESLLEDAPPGTRDALRASPRAWARIREAGEQGKRRLSTAEETHVAIAEAPLVGGGACSFEARLSRERVDRVTRPLLERLRAPLFRALADAKLSPSQVDEVLLVGGATRMASFVQFATNAFGRLPRRNLPPDEAVAMGAAVQAALKAGDHAVDDMVVTDVAPFSLGIATAMTQHGSAVSGLFSPILERGTVIPASREEMFATTSDGQREILVEIYQGEHALCQDNERLGELRVTGIPKGRAGEQAVAVRFTYDANGILDVDVTIIATKERRSLVIEQSKGRLTKTEVAAARERMARLKFHPREALPNVTALARADALHAELTGDDRAFLREMIAQFRLALERQDPALIDVARTRLTEVVEQYRQQRGTR